MEKYIIKLKNKVLREKEISYEEALNLISLDTNNKNDFDILLKSANEIREYFMGRKAVDRLLWRIENKKDPDEKTILSVEVIERDSVGNKNI